MLTVNFNDQQQMVTVSLTEGKKRNFDEVETIKEEETEKKIRFSEEEPVELHQSSEKESLIRLLTQATYASHFNICNTLWDGVKKSDYGEIAHCVLTKLLHTTSRDIDNVNSVTRTKECNKRDLSEMVIKWMNILKMVSEESVYLQKSSEYANTYFVDEEERIMPFGCFVPDNYTKVYWLANACITDNEIIIQFRCSVRYMRFNNVEAEEQFIQLATDLFIKCNHLCSDSLFTDLLLLSTDVTQKHFISIFSVLLSIKDHQKNIEQLRFGYVYTLINRLSLRYNTVWKKALDLLNPHYDACDFDVATKTVPDNINHANDIEILFCMKTNMTIVEYKRLCEFIIKYKRLAKDSLEILFYCMDNLSSMECQLFEIMNVLKELDFLPKSLNSLIAVYTKGCLMKQFEAKQEQMVMKMF